MSSCQLKSHSGNVYTLKDILAQIDFRSLICVPVDILLQVALLIRFIGSNCCKGMLRFCIRLPLSNSIKPIYFLLIPLHSPRCQGISCCFCICCFSSFSSSNFQALNYLWDYLVPGPPLESLLAPRELARSRALSI